MFACDIGHKEDTNLGESVGKTWYCTELIVIGFVTVVLSDIYLNCSNVQQREEGRGTE